MRWQGSSRAESPRMEQSLEGRPMDSWISIVAIISVLGGVSALVFALLRVRSELQRAERDRQVRAAGDATLLDSKLRDLSAAQNVIAGRFSQAIESQAKSQSELARSVAERLEALDKRLGDNLKDTAAKTAETLGGLQARLF